MLARERPQSMNTLHWRHNDHDGVSNHHPHGCLLNRLLRRRSKKNIEAPRHWPLCGEFTGTGEFPTQRASYAENVSIWWRHHDLRLSFRTIWDTVLCLRTNVWKPKTGNGILMPSVERLVWWLIGLLSSELWRWFDSFSQCVVIFTQMLSNWGSVSKRLLWK